MAPDNKKQPFFSPLEFYTFVLGPFFAVGGFLFGFYVVEIFSFVGIKLPPFSFGTCCSLGCIDSFCFFVIGASWGAAIEKYGGTKNALKELFRQLVCYVFPAVVIIGLGVMFFFLLISEYVYIGLAGILCLSLVITALVRFFQGT